MLKKDVTYENFDGDTVTETFHFHLSKVALAKLQVSEGGYEAYINRMMAARNAEQALNEIEKIVKLSIGEKSANGNRFIQNDEITNDFLASPAYEALFLDLCTSTDKQIEFITAVIPKGLDVDLDKIIREQGQSEDKMADLNKRVSMPKTVDESSITRQTQEVQREQVRRHEEAIDPGAPLIHPTEPVLLTREQVVSMDGQELKAGLASGRYLIG